MVALLAALVCWSPDAAADDLYGDTSRVVSAWTPSHKVVRLAPVFLYAGQVLPVRLPGAMLSGAEDACTTLAILGERTTSFVVGTSAGTRPNGERAKSERLSIRSVAGTAQVSYCGPARRSLRDLTVRLQAGRGTIEMVVAQGASAAPAPDHILPERATGPTGSIIDESVPPPLRALPVRAQEAEQRMQASGGRVETKRYLQLENRYGGALRIRLGVGCYRLMVLPDSEPGQAVDVDAEVQDSRGRVLVRDRSNAADAALNLCVGDPEPVAIVWALGGYARRVLYLQGRWELPGGIPTPWGPRARAGLGAALRRRTSPALTSPPIWEGYGMSGRTRLPIEVDPGGCYAFGLAATRGEVRSIAILGSVGVSLFEDLSGGQDGALFAFCAKGSRLARLDVDASGSNMGWVAGLWKTGSMPLGKGEAW